MVLGATGIVLKSTPYSESSLISRIYTHEFGKISLITRGAKKARGGKAGMLQPMNIIEFQMNFNESRDLQILREVSIKQNLANIRSNIQKMAVGLVMVEILDKTTQAMDISEILFRLIQKSLLTLDSQELNYLIILLFYKVQFAKYSGFNPIPEFCNHCNKTFNQAYYNPQNGFLFCTNCINMDGLELPEIIFQMLKKLSVTHIDELNSIEINSDSILTIEKYLTQFMIYHLNGMYNIKSLKFLNEVFSS